MASLLTRRRSAIHALFVVPGAHNLFRLLPATEHLGRQIDFDHSTPRKNDSRRHMGDMLGASHDSLPECPTRLQKMMLEQPL